MKKIGIFLTVAMVLMTMCACGAQMVELHCDYAGCDKTVYFTPKKGQQIDESWTIFCDECAKKVEIDMGE